ncbi:hypothetical protein TRSC58_07401 [Trypanosoma rangeli SC58]|uniref:Secreted protein n=1 Tax=Trypanosoma rangeli SC58 TaxID=429131 RepID=A0A061IS09_TRYRA|nr:hypothetical protein TRSC58_07401 [Trypanosoma rangeli SC58]
MFVCLFSFVCCLPPPPTPSVQRMRRTKMHVRPTDGAIALTARPPPPPPPFLFIIILLLPLQRCLHAEAERETKQPAPPSHHTTQKSEEQQQHTYMLKPSLVPPSPTHKHRLTHV